MATFARSLTPGHNAKLIGFSLAESIMSLDGVYNCRKNRKSIFNLKMRPNIPENKRNRKHTKRGRKQIYDQEIFAERFRTIERVFPWEDKFKRFSNCIRVKIFFLIYSLFFLSFFLCFFPFSYTPLSSVFFALKL